MKLNKPLKACAFAAFMQIAFACPALADSVQNYVADISVDNEGMLQVHETLDVNFTQSRHGIFRFIPVTFSRYRNTYSTPLRIQDVACDGRRARYKLTNQGDDINIRIGDPNFTISGLHRYDISYTVARAINFFSGKPEIYWNITGNNWPYAIERVTATVHLPPNVAAKDVHIASWAGAQGAREHATKEVIKDPHTVVFESGELLPSQGLTIAVQMPEGAVAKTPQSKEWLWWFTDWWPALVIPSVVTGFLMMLYMVSGRDQGDFSVAGVEWNPPTELTPAETGTLIDENCDQSDILATLIDLAARGYLTIEETQAQGLIWSSKDYLFTRTQPPAGAPPLKLHETYFLEGVFSSTEPGTTSQLSNLKYSFYPNLALMETAIYESLADEQYFVESPRKVRASYNGAGVLLGIVAFITLIAEAPSAWAIGLGIAAVACFIFSPMMPSRTKKGVDACRTIRGFKRFVEKAEKDRIRVLADKDPTIFGRMLPYAMVLGVGKIWAEKFRDLLHEPPQWYTPYGTYNNWDTTYFFNDLGSGMHTMSSSLTAPPPPSSSSSGSGGGFSAFGGGGGFSGGGFGGGGGGSW